MGSCTANAIALVLRHLLDHPSAPVRNTTFLPSRHWIYYVARANDSRREPGCDRNAISLQLKTQFPDIIWTPEFNKYPNSRPSDPRWVQAHILYNKYRECWQQYEGTQDLQALRQLTARGICPEIFTGYTPDKVPGFPSKECSDIAQTYKQKFQLHKLKFERLPQNFFSVVRSINQGFPVILDVNYPAHVRLFPDNGICPEANFTLEGEKVGHIVVVVGYDIMSRRLIIQNSWGRDWGDDGRGTVPEQWITKKIVNFVKVRW